MVLYLSTQISLGYPSTQTSPGYNKYTNLLSSLSKYTKLFRLSKYTQTYLGYNEHTNFFRL